MTSNIHARIIEVETLLKLAQERLEECYDMGAQQEVADQIESISGMLSTARYDLTVLRSESI